MPRETIYGSGMPINVSVAWGSGETVQVASIYDRDDNAEAVIGIVNEWLKAAGMDEVNSVMLRAELAKAGLSAPSFNGWHATIDDWPGVNRLIKVLKRARDQAFGGPE